MAIILYEGFDLGVSGSSQTNIQIQPGQFDNVSFNWSRSTSTRYSYGGSTTSAGGNINQGLQKNITDTQDIIIGLAYVQSSFGAADIIGLYSNIGLLSHIITVTATGLIKVTDGYGQTIGQSSSSNAFINNVWYYLEFRIKLHNTSGIIEIRKDGIDILNITGINTISQANKFGQVFLNGGGGMLFDDFYIVDNVDSTGFLGEVRCFYLEATADTGTVQWTPSSGSTHFSRVNIGMGASPTDTKYNVTSTISNRDLLTTLGTIPITPTSVLAVREIIGARAETNPVAVRTVLKSGSTTVVGSTVDLPTSYLTLNGIIYSPIYLLDPNGSIPWTKTSVEACSIGYDLVTP